MSRIIKKEKIKAKMTRGKENVKRSIGIWVVQEQKGLGNY